MYLNELAHHIRTTEPDLQQVVRCHDIPPSIVMHFLCNVAEKELQLTKLERGWLTSDHYQSALNIKRAWIEGKCNHVTLVDASLEVRYRLTGAWSSSFYSAGRCVMWAVTVPTDFPLHEYVRLTLSFSSAKVALADYVRANVHWLQCKHLAELIEEYQQQRSQLLGAILDLGRKSSIATPLWQQETFDALYS